MKKFPWKNWDEWESLYNMFFPHIDPEIPLTLDNVIPTDDYKAQIIEGSKLVSIWELRGQVPLLIKTTKNLLLLTLNTQTDNESLKYLISMHIIRAVNIIADHFRVSHTRSISTVAKEIGLPQLLVDLRHDATHKEMPSLEVLKTGLGELLKWIYVKYWQSQYTTICEEKRNSEKIIDFIINFGKKKTEILDITISKKAAIDQIMNVIEPYCSRLSYEGKCNIIQTLINEIMNSIEYTIDKPTLNDIIVHFLTTDQFAVSQLKDKVKLKIHRKIIISAVLKCLEEIYRIEGAKLIQGIVLEHIINHSLKSISGNYEKSFKYAIMYKFITKCSKIKLNKLMKSSIGLRKKVKLVERLRWVNLAAQATFNIITKKLQDTTTVDTYSNIDLKDLIEKYSKKEGRLDENKTGTLLDLTYRKRRRVEQSEDEMKIEEFIGKRKIICID